MKENKSITAIILVAGNSSRFGKNTNKNFELIKNKTVLSYSLSEFGKNKYIDNILIAAKEKEIPIIEKIIQNEKINKKVDIVIGGSERKESVYNSIKSTKSDIVIIHDGARPVIKQEYINNCINSMGEFNGVTIGVKSKDTIKLTNKENIVVSTTKRSDTWIIQTPQCFDRKILLNMYKEYKNEDLTDDCMLLEKGNYKVKVIEGEYTNIKITTSEDLNIVKQFLN